MAHLVNGGKYPHPFFFSVSSNPVIDNLLPVGHKCPSSACRLRTAVLGNSGSSINGAIGAPIWKRESIMRALIALAIVLALGSLASAQSQYTSNRVCPGNVALVYCNATNVSGSSVTVTMNLRKEDGTLMAVDAANGKPLWNFPTNHTWKASPMTYSFDGKQYVAVSVGSSIMTFGLPD